MELTHARWDSDVKILIKALKQAIAVGLQPGKPAQVPRRLRLGLALFAGTFLIAGASYMTISSWQKSVRRSSQIGDEDVRNSERTNRTNSGLPTAIGAPATPTASAPAAKTESPAAERDTPSSSSGKVSVILYVRDGTNLHGEFRYSGAVWIENFPDLSTPRYWTEVANPPNGKLRLTSGGALLEIDFATKLEAALRLNLHRQAPVRDA